MDLFDDILRQASSNSKTANKEIRKIDEACQKTRKCSDERIAAEKKQNAVKTLPVKREFVIPKKKATNEQPSVDKSKLELFLKRREEEKQRVFIEKKKQKEELLKLRLQTFGGKANKKLAKQFGSTPVELQQKYGNDPNHEEYLKRLQLKEEEEMDRLNTEWRGSVMKALARKKIVEKMARSGCRKNDSDKITTNRDNNSTYSMKDNSAGPSASNTAENKTKKTHVKVHCKRRLPPKESDFSLLMKKAEALQNDNTPESFSSFSIPPIPKKKNQSCEPSMDVNKNKPKLGMVENNKKSTSGKQRDTNKAADAQSGHSNNQRDQIISATSTIAAAPRRYLPGDIRYQPLERSQTSIKTNCSSSSNVNKNASKDCSGKDRKEKEIRKNNEGNRAASIVRRHDLPKRMMSREETVAHFKAHERMRLGDQRRVEKMCQQKNDQDEDVDDEEYDSEMDDFIDDSEFDEHLKRGDLEETLRLINPRYDKNRWKLRERMIDDRHMEASYRDIAREEKRSSRIGLFEDIREAQSGKSIAL